MMPNEPIRQKSWWLAAGMSVDCDGGEGRLVLVADPDTRIPESPSHVAGLVRALADW
jgi:hypothetical protein